MSRGWRIGYAACEEQIAKVMTNLQSQATSSPNSIAQAAVEAALTHGNGEVAAMVQEFKARGEPGRHHHLQVHPGGDASPALYRRL